jgi:GTP pyrophosphokinase
VPGDEIVGFVTKGYGVSIHRCDCCNASQEIREKQPERWVNASWAIDTPNEPYDTSLEVECRDRDNLLLDMAMAMSGMKIPISEINCRTTGSGHAIASLTFRVRSVAELNNVCAKLRSVPDVLDVRRGKT